MIWPTSVVELLYDPFINKIFLFLELQRNMSEFKFTLCINVLKLSSCINYNLIQHKNNKIQNSLKDTITTCRKTIYKRLSKLYRQQNFIDVKTYIGTDKITLKYKNVPHTVLTLVTFSPHS